MPPPPYLQDCLGRINLLDDQNLGQWKSSYDHQVFNHFEVMLQLRERFPDKVINRADIIILYQDDERYLAFIAGLVWGFINCTRPNIKNGDRTTTNLYRALNHPQHAVEAMLDAVELNLINGDCGEAFTSLMPNGEHRIPGVGSSYFSKVLFFLSMSNQAIIQKALIADKWTWMAFYALLAQHNPDEVNYYFSRINFPQKANRPGSVSPRSGVSLVTAYTRYVELLNLWAEELDVPVDKLEEYIFGYSLKIGVIEENPRMQLWAIVVEHRHLIQRNRI